MRMAEKKAVEVAALMRSRKAPTSRQLVASLPLIQWCALHRVIPITRALLSCFRLRNSYIFFKRFLRSGFIYASFAVPRGDFTNHEECCNPAFRQAAVLPLQRNDGPSFSPLREYEAHRALDRPLEQGIPTIITWSFGGNNVAVEGSWDNWRTSKTLQRSGKDHSILLVLPSGVFRYRFIVDGEVKYIPDQPTETDEMGRVCNLLDVHDYVPENLESVAEFEAPQSPESSYSQAFPGDEDFAKDPMLVPPQLTSSAVCSENQARSKPQHVVLNHLFMEKDRSSESVVALGLTHRFQSKYVTVVLYKPR